MEPELSLAKESLREMMLAKAVFNFTEATNALKGDDIVAGLIQLGAAREFGLRAFAMPKGN